MWTGAAAESVERLCRGETELRMGSTVDWSSYGSVPATRWTDLMGNPLAPSKAAWRAAGPRPCGPSACVTGFASAAPRPRTVARTCAPSRDRCRTCGPAPLGRDGLAPASPL